MTQRCKTCGVPLGGRYGPGPDFCTPHVRRGHEGGIDNTGTMADFWPAPAAPMAVTLTAAALASATDDERRVPRRG